MNMLVSHAYIIRETAKIEPPLRTGGRRVSRSRVTVIAQVVFAKPTVQDDVEATALTGFL